MLRNSRLARRVLVPAAAGVALVGAGPALATDDWVSGTISASNVRYADSAIAGSRIHVQIRWTGDNAEVEGIATDTATDGMSAVVELRYSVYYDGIWHTHYRFPVTASGSGNTAGFGPFRSRFATRGVVARACLTDNGNLVRCDPDWH